MDSFSQDISGLPHQNRHVKNEKKDKATLIGAGITAILVVVVLVAVSVANRNQETRSDASNPQGFVDDQGYSIVEESPWGYADDAIVPEPPLLSAEEYDQLYKEVREVFINRDYEGYKRLASTQRSWHVDHPFEMVAAPLGFSIAGKSTNIPGRRNFFLNAINGTQFNALPVLDIQVSSVALRDGMDDPYRLQVINDQTKVKTNIDYVPWKYVVDVKYTSIPSALNQGNGQVTFVYDKDHWAYQGEFWSVTPHTSPVKTGDDILASVEIDLSNVDNFSANSNFTISEGQAVTWKNMTGMVYSTDEDKAPWSTNYLYNDSFTKQFIQKGVHNYRVFYDDGGSTQVLNGVVNVE